MKMTSPCEKVEIIQDIKNELHLVKRELRELEVNVEALKTELKCIPIIMADIKDLLKFRSQLLGVSLTVSALFAVAATFIVHLIKNKEF